MPTVPFLPDRPHGNITPMVDPIFKAMAMADLYTEYSQSFSERAKATTEAIATGAMDPVGKNTTDFKSPAGVQNKSLLDSFSDLIDRKEPKSKEIPADKLSTYPSQDDAKEALKSGFGYGSGKENFYEAKNANVIGSVDNSGEWKPKGPRGYYSDEVSAFINDSKFTKNLDLDKVENWGLKEKLGTTFTQAGLAANRVPVAMLGFDPNRIAMDLVSDGGKVTLGGSFNPKADGIYANIDKLDPSTVLHESIHRGFEIVRQRSEEGKKLLKELPAEETVTRWVMHSMAGDPEANSSGAVNDKQRKHAVELFSQKTLYAQGLKDKLSRVMEIAAELHKEQRPGGPR